MTNKIKNIIKLFIPSKILENRQIKQNNVILENWYKNPSENFTPHIVKQTIIKEYQKKYSCTILIETGTYLGDMVEAQKNTFKQIISIELGIDLYKKAQKRFRNYKHINIVQGDSGKVLGNILKKINEPAIFWLDGHYSADITAKGEKDCPIFEELGAVFSSTPLNHILLIDDARLFVGQNDYPTLEDLTLYIKSKNEKYSVEIKNDIIRCVII